jgi:hypothetical protein
MTYKCHSIVHSWVYSPCKDLGRLTRDISLSM